MKKTFRLPKAFAIKWIEALRSGKYKQTNGKLSKLIKTEEITENELDNYGFCCLGVAGHICGNPISRLNTPFLYFDYGLIDIPNEILKREECSVNKYSLITVLSSLNDGTEKDLTIIDYNLRPDVLSKFESNTKLLKFSFSQIADFIEDNVEFYEIEENNQK